MENRAALDERVRDKGRDFQHVSFGHEIPLFWSHWTVSVFTIQQREQGGKLKSFRRNKFFEFSWFAVKVASAFILSESAVLVILSIEACVAVTNYFYNILFYALSLETDSRPTATERNSK